METTNRSRLFSWLASREPRAASSPALSQEELRNWLISAVSEKLQVPEGEVDTARQLMDYGLDSLQAVSIAGQLEKMLGRRLPPALIWDYPSIDQLAAFLAAGAETVRGE